MYANIFDSHAHYDDRAFDGDRHELLPRLFENGVVHIMDAAGNLDSSRAAMALADRYPQVFCAVGFHPDSAAKFREEDCAVLAEFSRHPKVKAIGEIGLDYHYDDDAPRPVQLAVFERQLRLALDLDLPVIVHDREAHQDTLDLLRKYRPRGVLHCYSGSPEMLAEVARLDFYVGFTGVVTFKNARKAVEAARLVPENRLLLETDCPYMAPEPHRGTRCDSSLLRFTGERLAEIRGLDPQSLFDLTCANACELFGC